MGEKRGQVKKLRVVLDLMMAFTLPVLMGYSLVGELYHEIIGIALGVLCTAHAVLNRRWFAALFRGRYSAGRVLTTAVNLLLVICVLTSLVSGVFLSKYVFRFLGISVLSSLMRTLHMLAAYWGFVLMSLHAGTHGGRMLAKLKSKPLRRVISGLLLLSAAYGVFAFMKRGFADFLFGRVAFVFFDRFEPFVLYYLDYLAVMLLFMALGYALTRFLHYMEKKN